LNNTLVSGQKIPFFADPDQPFNQVMANVALRAEGCLRRTGFTDGPPISTSCPSMSGPPSIGSPKALKKVVKIAGDDVTLQVFEGTEGIPTNAEVVFLGKSPTLKVSEQLAGRFFNAFHTLLLSLSTNK